MSLTSTTQIEPLNLNLIEKACVIAPTTNGATTHSDGNTVDAYRIFNLDTSDIIEEDLQLLSKSHDLNPVSIFIAAFNTVLQRYTGQPAILLGQALVKRTVETGEIEIGRIWSELDDDMTFIDLAKQVDNNILTDAAFKQVDEGQLTEVTANANSGFFQLFFIADTGDDQVAGDLTGGHEILKQLLPAVDDLYFGLYFKQTSVSFKVSVFFNPNRFNIGFFELFNNRLLNLLAEATKNPGLNLGAYNILGAAERKALLYTFNDTVVPYSSEITLFKPFEEQVVKHPQNIALIRGQKQITYHELNRQANKLSHLLIKAGITPGDNVGLLAGRDFQMITGMLAILKAGGAYVPIDPDYPLERQEYIFNQSSIKLVVADQNYPLKSLIKADDFILIEGTQSEDLDDTNPNLVIDSRQLAYTIYTSGSTGKPKGVMIEHHSAVNLVAWVNKTFNIDTTDRLLFITSMCFDLSVYDIFGMLAAGGALVIAQKDEIQNVQTLSEMMQQHGITFWDSVPTTMDYLVRTLEKENPSYRYSGLKTVFMSGDWIPVNLPDKIKHFFPGGTVVSLGGATEATVWSNFFIVDSVNPAWNSIPYGRPIDNNFFYILNDHLQPVPVGTVGDLYIGGVGVARGYANDEERTQRSFVIDPFHPDSGGMMYRTGDLGRMMPDYNMEFIGRKDNQVKIQGFRVELGEIESVLNNSGLLSSAVVLAKADGHGTKQLVAYVVYNQHNQTDEEALKAYLKKTLPDYMVPAIWVKLDSLPLTANGKIDRNALSANDDFQQIKTDIVGPETETERMLLNIWKDYFKKDNIGVMCSFFEIGGHSLMAVQILSKLKKTTGKNFQLSILYKYPTVRSLAQFIDQETSDYNFKSLVAIKPSGSKNPLYIIHGDGLNVLNFSHLAKHVHSEQPVYGLQALGLNGTDEPIDNLQVIAYHYMQEIIQHNPQGPYLLAGYSSGGYVAMEIRKQMVALGKDVKMLIIFDTDAEKTEYKDWYSLLPKKAKRHFPRMVQALKFSVNQLLRGKGIHGPLQTEQKADTKEFYKLVQKIKSKHITAFRNYQLEPFDGKLYLYKAKISVHYVEYGKYLGWEKYAQQGVELFEIAGDHFSMLQPPYVAILGDVLQNNIDEVMAPTLSTDN
ncbi:MAG TPA: amino acid adenylation domain-containing protein [Mucilaginibacter sp.]